MKLTIILQFLSIVLLLSFSCSLRRGPKFDLSNSDEHKLKKNEFKSKVIPRLLPLVDARPIGIQIYCESNKIISGSIKISTLKQPEYKYDRGIYLFHPREFDENNDLFKEIMVKDGNEFFLPYRELSSEITLTDPWFSAKYLHSVFKRTNQDTYNLYFYFDYSFWGTEESTENINVMRASMNDNRIKKQNEITNLKSQCNEAATRYSVNLALYEKLSKDKNAIDSQVTLFESKVAKEKKTIEDLKKQLEISEAKIADLQIQLVNEAALGNKIKTQISQLGQTASVNSGALYDLKNQRDNIDVKTLEEKKNSELLSFNKSWDALSRNCPQAAETLKKAKSALVDNKDLDGLQKLLREIIP